MTPAEHYREAERLLEEAARRIGGEPWEAVWGQGMALIANGHATLATVPKEEYLRR